MSRSVGAGLLFENQCFEDERKLLRNEDTGLLRRFCYYRKPQEGETGRAFYFFTIATDKLGGRGASSSKAPESAGRF
jgi:hypothetical protein